MPLTSQQWQKALNMEHIREHLIRVGLITTQGKILSRKDYEQHRNIRRHSPVNNQYQDRSNIRPVSDMGYRKSFIEYKKIDEHHRRSKSPSIRSRSPSPTRLTRRASAVTRRLSPSQPTRSKSAVDRSKSIPVHDRCLLTMIYYGPQSLLDSKRPALERSTDEIIIMQQHCGGENLLVFRGTLKPHETFEFRSRRRPDYPFALAFYVNGLVDHRLSICCEWRYRSNVRLGGKRALFGILRVQQAKPCRRCRIERRMARVTEKRMKKLLLTTPTAEIESILISPTSPKGNTDHDTNSSEFSSNRARKTALHGRHHDLHELHEKLLSAPRHHSTPNKDGRVSRQSIASIDSLEGKNPQ